MTSERKSLSIKGRWERVTMANERKKGNI